MSFFIDKRSMSDLEIETVRRFADGKSVRRDGKYKDKKGKWGRWGTPKNPNIEIYRGNYDDYSTRWGYKKQIPLSKIELDDKCREYKDLSPTIAPKDSYKIIEKMEKECESKETYFSMDYNCWCVEYKVPVFGHLVTEEKKVKNIKQKQKIFTDSWNGIEYNVEYVYQRVGTLEMVKLKRIGSELIPDVLFDNGKTERLTFEIYDATKNKDKMLLRDQKFNRRLIKKSDGSQPAKMTNVIVDFANEKSVTHIEIAADPIPVNYCGKTKWIKIADNIDRVPYIKSCKIFYRNKQSKSWIPIDIFKCNSDIFNTVLIDLLPYSLSPNGIQATQFKIEPLDWHIHPTFRIALYGSSMKKLNVAPHNEYITYTIIFPRPSLDTIYFPVRKRDRCGCGCGCYHSCGCHYHDYTKKRKNNYTFMKHEYDDTMSIAIDNEYTYGPLDYRTKN